MILLLDIGNTRVKWSTLAESKLGAQHADTYTQWTEKEFKARVLDGLPQPTRVLVANVGGVAIGDIVSEAVRHVSGIDAEFMTSTAAAAGVRNAYPEPQKLGVDRWMALIAAHNARPQATCIVSVGTAMTVDAMDAMGQHLGGLILPGPDLMIHSLLRNTSDLAQRSEVGSIAAGIFADNTRGAIYQGAVQALSALVDRACESIRTQLGVRPALLLTGGASDRLQGQLQLEPQIIPDLVLRGLAVIAQAT